MEALKLGAYGIPLIVACIAAALMITLYLTKKMGTITAARNADCERNVHLRRNGNYGNVSRHQGEGKRDFLCGRQYYDFWFNGNARGVSFSRQSVICR